MSDTDTIDAAPSALRVIDTPTQQMAVTAPNPAYLLQMAVQQGADLDRLERLMALQERWEQGEARKAFNVAFAAFKAEGARIVKNVDVKDGPLKGKRYADLFAVVDALTPALSQHGLSASWRLTKDEKDWLEVTCVLAHVSGHAETVSMGGPPDSGGAKNQIQARASAQSYLRRYTFLAITGMAAADEDDDGAGAGTAQGPSYTGPLASLLSDRIATLQKTTTDEAALNDWKQKRAEFQSDKAAYDAFKKACEAHRNTLKGGAA